MTEETGGSAGTAIRVLLAAAAHPGKFGRPLVSFGCVSSTNDAALELAAQGAPEGTAVVADQQQRGRGRMGREWVSPLGGGLWCSLVLRPALPLRELGPLALVGAVAARAAIGRTAHVTCKVKWPNDLLVGGRKAGGILTEASGGSLLCPPDFVVMGIGINVNLGIADLPPELRDRATSLSIAAGSPVPVAGLGAALLAEVERAYGQFTETGFAALREEWIAGSETIGREVTVTGASILRGWAETIDMQGRLVLRLPDGRAEHIAAGDVSLAHAGSGSGPFAAGR
ncbi:MAG: biotin--[acetyl-CoA-carboxylase] ligase [Bacillota bacterium]|nr:biotin--[acetyl-CoA-carboxylase] ligase [Bacillota bacterium]